MLLLLCCTPILEVKVSPLIIETTLPQTRQIGEQIVKVQYVIVSC